VSHEKLELVRRVTDVMYAEGFEAALPVFLEVADADVEWREDPVWPGSGHYRGVEQVQQVILDRSSRWRWSGRSGSRRSPKFFLDRAEAPAAAGLPTR
jgi:hypothetical protein